MWIFLLSLNTLCILLFNYFFNTIGHSCKKLRMLWSKFKSPAYAIAWPNISLDNTLKFLDHNDDGNFLGSGKRISIIMTTAWRCAPCQRMRRREITQWSGDWACNLLAKIEFQCGWLRWREWDCVGALLGRSATDRVAATRAHAS